MNLAPCQRSHRLRFEPGTAANQAAFKAQGHADWTCSSERWQGAYFIGVLDLIVSQTK